MTESGAELIKGRHGEDFRRYGVSSESISKLIMQTATGGADVSTVVGHSRPTRLVEFGNQRIPVALSIATSGYIISAHPEPLARTDGSQWPPANSRPIRIRLAAEWGAGPLWVSFGPTDETVAANYLPEEIRDVLNLPAALLLDIARWDHDYQRILDENYPPDSKFQSDSAALRFRRTGFALAKHLRAALPPEIAVEYAENFSDRILTIEMPRPAVAVHEVRPDHIPGFTPASGAIHVDLPHSQVNQWLQHLGRGPGQAVEVDVRNVPSAQALAHAISPGASTLAEALVQIRAKALLFTKVEQLGVKNRPALVELLHALPAALATRKTRNAAIHIGLVDLSSAKADIVLAELQNAPAEGIDDPVTVHDYPAMP
ncbi:hypothetical protein LZ318_12345 [Saccharopolyspora indica]|uniref:hypothetical protein n=1 Tax=Saccharopolyspora indica TaxID=1229659 RepID=UPI0022EB0CB9|nr:hypothetical protein [Saccharopolyspora indica]MDA3643700.1 hypothetical protein [Saccharopolyspora indica]